MAEQLNLRGDFRIETPEQVSFHVERAGIGSRIFAAFIDSIILAVLYIGVVIAFAGVGMLGGIGQWANDEVVDDTQLLYLGLVLLVTVFLYWTYYIGFEGFWNGQTPGKRALGIRVVGDGGLPASFGSIAIRNLLRIVDGQLGYAVGLVTIFASSQEKRLGDLAAGTIVIREKRRRGTSVRFGEATPTGRRVDADLLELIRHYFDRGGPTNRQARERVATELVVRVQRQLNRSERLVAGAEVELAKIAAELMEPETPGS